MGATFPADHRGSAAAVPARPVLRRLRSGARAVPRHRRGPVGIIDHPADDAVAGRGPRLRRPRPLGCGLRLPVGRRDSPENTVGTGETVPAGDDRGARGRTQGARRADRRVPRVARVVGRPAARLPPPRHARPDPRGRRRCVGLLESATRGLPGRRRSSVVGSTSRRMPLLRFRSRHIRARRRR